MSTPPGVPTRGAPTRGAWAAAGVVAGLAGVAVSHAAAQVMNLRSSPVVAVAETVIDLVPGTLAANAIEVLGHLDKPVLVLVIMLVLLALSALAGHLARRNFWLPTLIFLGMGVVAMLASTSRQDSTSADAIPIAAGVVVWIVVLSFLTGALRQTALRSDGAATDRRGFLKKSAVVVVVAGAVALLGEVFGGRRRTVEQARKLLRLPITEPTLPVGVSVGVPGMPDWQTPNEDFYLIHTALVTPAIEPGEWSLRIHGMVDREITLSFEDLIDDSITERWVTLNCVSNPVGGPLIGNAWWSGVLLSDLLERAGVQAGADAILQTSHDGWNCGTPLDAVTDPERHAMLAFAMNGKPLPIDHGFPVRTIVPGLYGYVSACKWVTDIEVTRFEDFEAYWTGKGWGERGPVKISSRIDVPHNGEDVASGSVTIAGHAWSQDVGISGVQIAVDGGAWSDVALAEVPSEDTWVQWKTAVELEDGDHTVRVRAIGADGTLQTGARVGVLPDGATGWDEIGFTVG